MAPQRVGQAGHTHPSDGTAALGVVTGLARVGAEGAPRVGGHVSQVGRGKGGHKRALKGQRRAAVPCRESCKAHVRLSLHQHNPVYSQSPWERWIGGLGTSQGVGQEQQGRTGCTRCHFREEFTPPWCADSAPSSPSPTSALPSVSPASHGADQSHWSTLAQDSFSFQDLQRENYWS